MGMSASQARLLYITTQLNHLSLQGQNVSDAKIRLSMDSEAIQEKYTQALNNSSLYVNNNIFTATGSTTNRERISLAALAAQDLLVYNGSTVLGYKYEEVDTGRTEKKLVGYEKDLTKPIYGTKEETETFRSPSASADKLGSEDLNTMNGIVESIKTDYAQYGITDDDIRTVSYTSNIGGEEKTVNAIAISSQNALVGVLNELFSNPEARKQNYVLDFPEGTVIDFSQINPTNDWPGISQFQGLFDGNGVTFSNLNGSQGLFADLYGTVKNLNIDGANISAETDIIGGLAGYLADAGSIENCNVSNVNITCNLQGGVDYQEGFSPERAGVGGLVGLSNGDIKNSSAQGTINVPNADDSFGYIGGFIGANINPQKGESIIENCYSDVDIVLSGNTDYSNSINGFIGDDSFEATIKNCISLGKITTSSGAPINGSDLANWGPVLESDAENLIALDTRNNNNVLYWSSTTSPNWDSGSTKIPSNLGGDWLMPGDEGYADQTQATAQGNNLPVLNLTKLQEEALAKEETKEVEDPDNIIGYEDDLTKPIYEEVPIMEMQLVKDPDFAGLSSAELEKGLREGTYTLVQKAAENSTQSITINGTDYELVSWQTCTDIVDKQDEAKLAVAEAEYEKGMAEIQAKDKEYEIDQKKIDTQYKALQTEEESIKTILSKNVERSFKTFG